MRLSRRSAIAAGSVFAASAAAPFPVLASIPAKGTGPSQVVQRTVIFADETGGAIHSAPVAIDAGSTMWASLGALDETAYRKALAAYRARGYGLRHVNMFETKDGVRYSAAWQFGHNAPAQLRDGMTLAAFKAEAARAQQAGYALADVDAATTGQGARFAAIWEKSGAPAQKIFAGLAAEGYEKTVAEMAALGFRPQRIAGYADAGRARFVAVFAQDGVAHVAMTGIPAESFPEHMREQRRAGYVLRDASGYVAGGRALYTAVWEHA
ncbi:MAG TPA: hypothetical protein VG387_15575 [Rhizomicrobium sp.]|jgi:hypothetical protein|nr:hypothetical protein [Rhizomicrobium sp.]